ncbi:hypothetical protein RJ640_024873 [Escallonia rubra]|uniref:RING-type E3 ubiquitin transferase n=1 Tax=Escallonia rubra TaxID=112253 RepID=A0AA88RQ93_9ASTE|nr:hypothetical protein RJ640_024873 [Escallonia rubra]
MEEHRRLEEARLAEEAALTVAEKEKARSKAALEHAEAAQRIAELEAQKRSAKIKVLKEAEEKDKILDALAKSDVRYMKYSIEELEAATSFRNLIKLENEAMVSDSVSSDEVQPSPGSIGSELQLKLELPRMGLTHHVEKAIERGSFAEMLDQTVPDWPVEEALSFAKWFSNVLCYEGKIGQILARLSCQNLRD